MKTNRSRSNAYVATRSRAKALSRNKAASRTADSDKWQILNSLVENELQHYELVRRGEAKKQSKPVS